MRAHDVKGQGDVFSLLRASVSSRLILAGVAACVVWLGVWWALT